MRTTKNSWRTRWVALCAGLALGMGTTAASAALINLTLTNIPSIDGLGDPDNFVASIDLTGGLGLPAGSSVDIDGIGWDVTIDATSPSWLSEARIDVRDGTGTSYDTIIPGDGINSPGIQNFNTGGVQDVTPFTLADGVLVLEFFESFVDFPDATEATWNGTLTFRTPEDATVPAPATLMLLAAGIGGLLVRRRRR